MDKLFNSIGWPLPDNNKTLLDNKPMEETLGAVGGEMEKLCIRDETSKDPNTSKEFILNLSATEYKLIMQHRDSLKNPECTNALEQQQQGDPLHDRRQFQSQQQKWSSGKEELWNADQPNQKQPLQQPSTGRHLEQQYWQEQPRQYLPQPQYQGYPLQQQQWQTPVQPDTNYLLRPGITSTGIPRMQQGTNPIGMPRMLSLTPSQQSGAYNRTPLWQPRFTLKMPTFNGTNQSATDFLSQFDIYCKQMQIQKESVKDILQYCLRERALIWYNNTKAINPNLSAAQLLEKFKVYFLNTSSQDLLRKQLRNQTFKLGDNLAEHLDKLTSLWLKMEVTSEVTQVNDLIDSIQEPELALYIKSRSTATVEDCINSLKTYIEYHSMKPKVSAVQIQEPPPSNHGHQNDDEVYNQRRGRSRERHGSDNYRRNRRDTPRWNRDRSSSQNRSGDRYRGRQQNSSRERNYDDRSNYSYRNNRSQSREYKDRNYDNRREYNYRGNRSHSRDRRNNYRSHSRDKRNNYCTSRDRRNNYRSNSQHPEQWFNNQNGDPRQNRDLTHLHPDQCGLCHGWGHHMNTCSSRWQGNIRSMAQDQVQ